MKNISAFLYESISVNEGAEKYFRFTLEGLDGIEESVKRICDSKGIYYEKIDGGLKIKIKDKDIEKADALVDVLVEYVNAHQQDEEGKDKIDALTTQSAKLSEYLQDKKSGADEDDEEEDGE